MHTPLCGHATGAPREYAQAALDAGLAGICFTDHMPMPAWYDAPWRMRRDQLAQYVADVQDAQAEFAGRLEVRLGLEADFHPGTERYVEEVLGAHPWDYVIGSVHYIGAWGFDNPEFTAEYDSRDLGDLIDGMMAGFRKDGTLDAIFKRYGVTPTALVDAVSSFERPDGVGYLWFAGEAGASRAVRAIARKQWGFDTRHCSSIGYWRERAEEWLAKYKRYERMALAGYNRALREGRSEAQAQEEFEALLERVGL